MRHDRDPIRVEHGRRVGSAIWGWVALTLVLALFIVGVVWGLVALAHAPAVEGLLVPEEPPPPAPQDKIDHVPAPDNAMDGTPRAFEEHAEDLTEDQPEMGIPGLDAPDGGPP